MLSGLCLETGFIFGEVVGAGCESGGVADPSGGARGPVLLRPSGLGVCQAHRPAASARAAEPLTPCGSGSSGSQGWGGLHSRPGPGVFSRSRSFLCCLEPSQTFLVGCNWRKFFRAVTVTDV